MPIHSYFNAFSAVRFGRIAKHAVGLIGLGAVLVSCATGPKPVRISGIYAIESALVTSTSNRALFANGLQERLEAQIVGEGIGAKARLSVNITDLRYRSENRAFLMQRSNIAAINVVLKSSASGLTLRNFRLSARSEANDRAIARQELAQSFARQLSQIFPIIMPIAPKAAPPKAPKAVKVVKKIVASKPKPKPKPKPKAVETPRIVEINQFPERTEPAPVAVSVQPKRALVPVASATPNETAIVEPITPPITPAPVAIIEAPSIEPTPIAEATPPVSAEVAPDDDELCVVTLENDCSGVE